MRHTEKTQCGRYSIVQNPTNAINKLGALEDIEEELGIDLVTLFKALKEGVFLFDKPKSKYPTKVTLKIGRTGSWLCDEGSEYYCDTYDLNKYGLQWALTKEELEDKR